MDWQDIESAPKDGTRVLLAYAQDDGRIVATCGEWLARQAHRRAYWSHDHESTFGVYWTLRHQPTYWAPIPRAVAGQEWIPADVMPVPGMVAS